MPAYKQKKSKDPNTTQIIKQTVLPGQRSAPGGNLLNYLYRVIPAWMNPQWTDAVLWRNFVLSLPAAVLYRDTAISNIVAKDWKIVPRDTNMQDELHDDIIWYTRLFENEGEYDGLDYTGRTEWLLRDMMDLPFGGAVEIGREGDDPEGKVMWLRALDGGTLMPSLNSEYPVIQRVPNIPTEPIAFPKHTIARIYMMPRSDIWKEGWGMAPPESIYLAMELLRRGDKYFAELLLNTPEAGILDLGDMEKEAAQEWAQNARELFVGVDPFKIPVLYEHTTEVKWIPFVNRPNEIMFDEITMRYLAFVGSAYGMKPADIGLGGGASGGETLSGTIRDERAKKSSGEATRKKKLKAFYDKILPKELEWKWLDYDEEELISHGRANLAFAQADQLWIATGVFGAQELRTQHIQDGLITVSIPEKIPADVVPQGGNTTLHPELLGEGVHPTQGGRGEISQPPSTTIRSFIELAKKAYAPIKNLIADTKTMTQEERDEWENALKDAIWWENPDEHMVQTVDKIRQKIREQAKKSPVIIFSYADEDIPAIKDTLYQRSLEKIEDCGKVINESMADNVLGRSQNVAPFIEEASQTSSGIMSDLLVSKTIELTVNSIKKFGIDYDTSSKDNKNKVIAEVVKGLSDCYQEYCQASQQAGQEILDQRLDMEADNVAKDS